MTPDEAYRLAVQQFSDCLRRYADDQWAATSWCGWDAGWSYGINEAIQRAYAWQLVAGVSWLLSAALAALVAWLWWRGRGVPVC